MVNIKEKIDNDYLLKLLLVALILFSLFIGFTNQFAVKFSSDLYPLVAAVNDYTIGANPYRHVPQSMFVYHPIILKVLVGLNKFIPLRIALFIFYALAIIWFIYQSYRWLIDRVLRDTNKSDGLIWILFISLSFGGVAIASLICGNLSAYFHLLLVGLIFHYSRKKNVLTLYVFGLAIVCFAIVKPYLLAYVLFYFLAIKKSYALAVSLMLSVSVALIWLSAMYLQPAEFEQFSSALQYQLLIKDDLGGFSSLRLTGPYLGFRAAFLFHLGAVGLALYLMFVIVPNKVAFMKNSNNQILVILLFIIFINPRLVFYDFFMAVFVLFYLVYINFPNTYGRIIFPGFLIAIFSQLVVHPTRWLILSYLVVVVTFVFAVAVSHVVNGASQSKNISLS